MEGGVSSGGGSSSNSNNNNSSSSRSSSNNATSGRWTCEACGCNTNQSTDRNCSICGTSNSGPSILRRPGGASFAARAGWFARGLGARRGIMNDELGIDDDELWDTVVNGVADDPDSALESFLSGENNIPSRNRLLESQQRFMDAARAFSQVSREGRSIEPEQLLRQATENSSSYQPIWAQWSSLISARSRLSNSGIEVGEGDRSNLAHLKPGASEGLAVRAENPLPKNDVLAPFRMGMPSSSSGSSPQRRAYGFRIAFDHPTCEQGGNLGGCYLIGITTSSFTAYGDQNGLQQSPFFWGIEDSGLKYEGSRHNQSRGSRRPSSNSTYSIELGPQEAPMNAHGVLFGSREVVSVVVDLESRNLTFWRDETLLGTLVHNIPRTGNLYPVAVPFSCGVTVAITSLDNDPLPLLRNFATDWKKIKQESDEKLRQQLSEERSALIKDRKPTPRLIQALKQVFWLYTDSSESSTEVNMLDERSDKLSIGYVAASKLWYRCGLKLSNLDKIAVDKGNGVSLAFPDFLDVVEKVVAEDSDHIENPSSDSVCSCEVGDKVELVEGYEKFGDAAGGPLQPGDRGIVVELQKGPYGEKRSIRVLHSGRRWWYQPQAVLSERSGLIETSAVWFIRGILRSHGYDPYTLESLVGKPVTPESWRYRDIVSPLSTSDDMEGDISSAPMQSTTGVAGRIVPEIASSSSLLAPNSRESGTVFVEYMGREFAEAVGIKSGFGPVNVIDSRRIRTSKLIHSSIFRAKFHDIQRTKKVYDDDRKPAAKHADNDDFVNIAVSEKVRADIAGLGRLERTSIDAVTKECKKGSDALASLFYSGLPEAILTAVSVAERQMNSLEPREDVAEKLLALGGLANAVVEQLFSEKRRTLTRKVEPEPAEYRNTTSNLENNLQQVNDRRIASREVGTRRELRRDEGSMPNALQQRRNMILTLMSRARRGNAAAYLNDLVEGRMESGEFPPGYFPPSLAAMREVPPFVFGSPSDFMDAWSSNESHSRNVDNNDFEISPAEVEADARNLVNAKAQYTFLDSVLRCRSDGSLSQVSAILKQGGAAFAIFARNLISSGILVNSAAWTKAIVDEHSKKTQIASMQRPSAVLKSIVDEEGTPLLQLAISLGCSSELLNLIIGYGCPIGVEEIRKAATTDQPEVLSLLLQHISYTEEMIDLNSCSPDICRILEETKSRQSELDKRMRETAGIFIVQLLRKLFKLCLSARRNQTAPRLDQCSKAICEVLVGNVLLRALHSAQKAAVLASASDDDADSDRDTSDKSGRFSVDETSIELSINPQGLLGSLPRSLLGECLLSEPLYFTQYMMVIEDYLYSKDMADTASGLTFLVVLLNNFPQLKRCSEMDRFGIVELISYHNVLASSRIADILSKQVSMQLNVSSPCRDAKDDSELLSTINSGSESGNSIVLCPKKHKAVLHITRHSSFRCDLCGNGVERGRPMHGCRECDWDACEECTDRAESGLVKSSAVKGIASDCLRLMEDITFNDERASEFQYSHIMDELAKNDSSLKLSAIAVRLLQRDVQAAKELGLLLKEEGEVSIHQFLTIILPPLHASLVGRSSGNPGPGHRSKKPRVVERRGDLTACSPDLRLEYCREALRSMVMEPGRVVTRASLHTGIGSHVVDKDQSQDSQNENPETESEEELAVISREIGYAASSSAFLRFLHQVLSLNENVQIISSAEKRDLGSLKGGDLQSLTKPVEVHFSPATAGNPQGVAPKSSSVVYVEPLLPIGELKMHILRTYRSVDPVYESFCQRLAKDGSIIIERSHSYSKDKRWRLAKVLGFDRVTGSHEVATAVGWVRDPGRSSFHLMPGSQDVLSTTFHFSEATTKLVLAARDYYILERNNMLDSLHDTQGSNCPDVSMINFPDVENRLAQAIGTRVESNCASSSWDIYTLIGVNYLGENSQENDYRFVLVADDGQLYADVTSDKIRLTDVEEGPSRPRRRSVREERSGSFPFFAARQRSDVSRDSDEVQSNANHEKALRRSWSALSLIDSMKPVDLNIPVDAQESQHHENLQELIWECQLVDSKFRLSSCISNVEVPPRLNVLFSMQDSLADTDLCTSNEKTFVRVLKDMRLKQEKWPEWPPKPSVHLFFTIQIYPSDHSTTPTMPVTIHNDLFTSSGALMSESKADEDWYQLSRCRKLSSNRSITSDDEVAVSSLCDGIDELCMQCMEIISLLAECAENNTVPKDKDDSSLAGFANINLSKKLTEQLDDPLFVVGGALPEWCVAAPSFSPRVFSYDARRALLERAAFGVSRSTLKQQEAKINVGRLRQRMASLRARAVELVGEAFSGGAEDPTALQLQADELYGMEEALATRVRAAFRAAKWQEHTLQVAKAAVRRGFLLSDATSVMDRYAKDPIVCRRRLEVRFDGESGFDAASGDEAGVTRGFYADVAEALLSVENVAGVYCSSKCSSAVSSPSLEKYQQMEIEEGDNESRKLPLWIPDLDSSSQVVIPTPRAEKRSGLGVFPRPIPSYHPQMPDVILKFRFMGRLFASAMRDGFMFPLPISAAFLKVVQHGRVSPVALSTPDNIFDGPNAGSILSSADLPRPGFLGGEIFAADYYICRALDDLDSLDPPLPRSELIRRYEAMETDKNFGRVALGKSYDLSFKEYFEDRTFVDPLDPTQGEDAVPLCPKGYSKPVTIFNIREWVALAKNFFLHEGIISQALAFRQGVEDFFALDFLRLFTSDELQRDVCGMGGDVDNWDESAIRKLFKLDGGKGAAEALVAVAAIGGEGGAALSRRFGPSSPTIAFLVKALIEASPVQRRQFLSFVTSVPIVTPGKIEVVPMVSPSGEFRSLLSDPCCLPRANTCSRRLYLPKFDSYESFTEVLWAVVRQESKFKGFYEWRGN